MKLELVYFKGCPSVPAARAALRQSGFAYNEIVQDDLPEGDPRRDFSSPSLLADGKPVIGGASCAAACSLDDWASVADRLKNL
jgi:hypothetical protein